jgi:hypothetical protein
VKTLAVLLRPGTAGVNTVADEVVLEYAVDLPGLGNQ